MAAAPPTEWDAQAYHRVSSPQFSWGTKVLQRLPLRGDETVIDAGCGSGRLSEKVLERIPRGQLIALDSSQNMLREAKALQKKHDAWLKDLRERGLTPEEALAAYADRSVANLSSLVMLARAGGRTMLLTGDARGDRILEGLEEVGALTPGQALHVDVLKVPHHGSANNVEREFFERVTADHYVFSGDGEHGNPERESLEMLLDARGSAAPSVIGAPRDSAARGPHLRHRTGCRTGCSDR